MSGRAADVRELRPDSIGTTATINWKRALGTALTPAARAWIRVPATPSSTSARTSATTACSHRAVSAMPATSSPSKQSIRFVRCSTTTWR